eukprot:11566164-Ditylum_brightwellii.AAC.1
MSRQLALPESTMSSSVSTIMHSLVTPDNTAKFTSILQWYADWYGYDTEAEKSNLGAHGERPYLIIIVTY